MLIKVESMKMELDNMLDKMYEKLDEEKKKNKNMIISKVRDSLKKANYCLKYTSKHWTVMNAANKEKFYDCVEVLNKLSELNENLMREVHQVKFEPCNEGLNEALIGKLVTPNNKQNEESRIDGLNTQSNITNNAHHRSKYTLTLTLDFKIVY